MKSVATYIWLSAMCVAALPPDPCVPALLQLRSGSAKLRVDSAWQQLKPTTTVDELQALHFQDESLNVTDAGVTSIFLNNYYGYKLSGKIPDFSQCTALMYMDLTHNYLTGEMADFSNNVNLVSLDVSWNRLTGNIPKDFSKNANLKFLYLDTNFLSGTIPDFSQNTALEAVLLFTNKLTGELPLSLIEKSARGCKVYVGGNASAINNELTLPDMSKLADDITILDLSPPNFNLIGEIGDFSKNTALQKLFLGGNKLTGEIGDFSKNTGLQQLWLEGNELTGEIGDFSKNTALQVLRLEDNKLTGVASWCADISDRSPGCAVDICKL